MTPGPLSAGTTPTVLTSITLPPGDYLTAAKVSLTYSSGGTEESTCTLSRPPNTTSTSPSQPAFDVATSAIEDGSTETVALRHFALTADFSGSPQTINLACWDPHLTSTETLTAFDAVIQATQFNATHQQP